MPQREGTDRFQAKMCVFLLTHHSGAPGVRLGLRRPGAHAMLLGKLCVTAEEVPCVQPRGPVTTWGTLDTLPANQDGEER